MWEDPVVDTKVGAVSGVTVDGGFVVDVEDTSTPTVRASQIGSAVVVVIVSVLVIDPVCVE